MKYTVLHPVTHNGERHEPGAVVSMAEKHGAPLVAAGVLAEVEVVKPADKPTQAQLDAAAAEAAKAAEAALAAGGDLVDDANANSEAAGS